MEALEFDDPAFDRGFQILNKGAGAVAGYHSMEPEERT
jgi:hypothetical protein